jgi:hypothetical protein
MPPGLAELEDAALHSLTTSRSEAAGSEQKERRDSKDSVYVFLPSVPAASGSQSARTSGPLDQRSAWNNPPPALARLRATLPRRAEVEFCGHVSIE